MRLFDSHAHYNDEKFEQDREQILQKVYESGVTNLICAGYSLESSKQAIEIAKTHDFIHAIVGISPNDIPGANTEEKQIDFTTFQKKFENQLESLETLIKYSCEEKEKQQAKVANKQEYSLVSNNKETANRQNVNNKKLEEAKIVAIGEIGLDYYWNKENKENQKWAFMKQIDLANHLNLPIVIHTREAVVDTIDILKNQIIVQEKGIFHCCPLNLELIKEGLKLGFAISFAGPVTFKNSKNAEEAIKLVPLEKILIETDSPYLAPEPNRGTRNDSSNVKYIAEKIAHVKEISVEEVAKATYENAKQIFKIED